MRSITSARTEKAREASVWINYEAFWKRKFTGLAWVALLQFSKLSAAKKQMRVPSSRPPYFA
jgi:hypothetical protein